MLEQLIVLEGNTFFVSDPNGDVEAGEEPRGFFHSDTRHLSEWRLLVGSQPLRPLASSAVNAGWGRVFATLPWSRIGESARISVRRDRLVSGGVHEDVMIENHSEEEVSLTVDLRFSADFADIFEVKVPTGGGRPVRRVHADVEEGAVTMWYEREGFRRATTVSVNASSLRSDRARFRLHLGPGERWQTCVEVVCEVGGIQRGRPPCPSAAPTGGPPLPSGREWVDETPMLETDHDTLTHVYRQSLADLAALRFRPLDELTWSVPAAGLPWFMALFGRDSLITAYQALPFQPQLAATTLEALAALQAADFDDYRDAEPGKILHELRRGELAATGRSPHNPYYGTHDATPLFLVLLDEYHRWTGDSQLVGALLPAARAALAWMERHGDLDGDGYLEYQTRSRLGLRNQCWKDSGDSIRFADGRLAQGAIATCEIQGYAYDARMRVARLAREVWGDDRLADRLEDAAAELRKRFNRDFWMKERDSYALALDGDKRPVDSLTSNVGHLLWSGIVDEERAAPVVEGLMDPEMWNGWGIRTMSSRDGGYAPMAYHTGSVWPHDTAIVAEGMRRYGFRAPASTLVLALLDAADGFGYRLPELLSGFPREETLLPVEYPEASRPQAWSAAAPLLGLRTLLGLDPTEKGIACQPHLPLGIGRIRLWGVPGPAGREDLPGDGDLQATS